MGFKQKIAIYIIYYLTYIFYILPECTSRLFLKVRIIKIAAINALIKKYGNNKVYFNLEESAKPIKLVKAFDLNTLARNQSAQPKLKYKILIEADDFVKNAKVAIIAHYDPDNLIDDYVVNYLYHINLLGYNIILVTCKECEISDQLKNIVSALVIRLEPGYDFTSWQVAFEAFPHLYDATEILISNDSIFAPVGSFEHIHKAMNQVNCDFWGLCESQEHNTHLQSYYLVFKEKAIQNEIFKNFWSSLRVKNRQDAIKAELSLTTIFMEKGLKAGAYITSKCLPFNNVSPMHFFWNPLVTIFGVACFKRNLLAGEIKYISTYGWRDVARSQGYNVDLIDNYFARIKHSFNIRK